MEQEAGESQPILDVDELRAVFYLRKTRSTEEERADPGERKFHQKWLPLSSFVRADGSVKTTKLLKSYLRIERPNHFSFYGGFFFVADGKPWGFSFESGDKPFTADYVAYASYWFDAAVQTWESDGTCRFWIYGHLVSISRSGEVGILRDEGHGGKQPRWPALRFRYRPFLQQIWGQSCLYQRVYEDLMRRANWAGQDSSRMEHVAVLREHFPSFGELHQKLEALNGCCCSRNGRGLETPGPG